MQRVLRIGKFELQWLKGGSFELDGGTMFGPVPKRLWNKKLPCNPENFVPLSAWPILIKTPEALVIVESGLGNKLAEKQIQTFRVRETWSVPEALREAGIRREDIRHVILTHCDWDHSAGIVMREDGDLKLTFPRAKHIIQRTEWEDILALNKRSVNTYWPINLDTLRENGHLDLIDGDIEIVRGVKTILTGGHTRGHQAVVIESQGEKAVHFGDILPTHAHFKPLWITAYDNFPLDSVLMKERYIPQYVEEGAWFVFYHDPLYHACKFDEKGNVVDAIEMEKNRQGGDFLMLNR